MTVMTQVADTSRRKLLLSHSTGICRAVRQVHLQLL
jgi:hypothetical protein